LSVTSGLEKVDFYGGHTICLFGIIQATVN